MLDRKHLHGSSCLCEMVNECFDCSGRAEKLSIHQNEQRFSLGYSLKALNDLSRLFEVVFFYIFRQHPDLWQGACLFAYLLDSSQLTPCQ